MFDKLMQAQQMAEEARKKLDGITVYGEAEGGKIKVAATANKLIQSVTIDPQFLTDADTEELEDLLVVAINKALEQAESVSQEEMQTATRGMMGDLGAMFGQ